MKFVQSVLLTSLILFFTIKANSQCNVGCNGPTFAPGATVRPTAANQVICITQPGTYNFESQNHQGVTLRICADNVIIGSFRASARFSKLETFGANTELKNLDVGTFGSVDTVFTYMVHSKGAKFTGNATLNGVSQFKLGPYAQLNITPSMFPGEKIYIRVDKHAVLNVANITSNKGGTVHVGSGGKFNSSGTVFLQSDGKMFNEGDVTVAQDMTVQGGENALNNYCGTSKITIGGTFIVNNGTMNNAGTIKSGSMLVNSVGGPILPHMGSVIETDKLISQNKPNLFLGDSLPDGQCGTFRITEKLPPKDRIANWNEKLTASSKVNYCGPPASSQQRGSATVSCLCTSTLPECPIFCQRPNAGNDQTFCTTPGTADLVNASGYQVWERFPSNPAAATINRFTGVVSGMTAPGVYRFILRDTSGTLNRTCLDTISITVNKEPSTTLTITGSTVCNNDAAATVIVQNAEPKVTYNVVYNNSIIGTATNNGTTTTNLAITNVQVAPLALGTNVVRVTANIVGCGPATLADTAAIIKNAPPAGNLTINGSTVCSDEPTATVTVLNAQAKTTYSAYLGNTLLESKTNTGDSPVNLVLSNIQTSQLQDGLNIISMRAQIAGCGVVNMTDTAGVRKIKKPVGTSTISGSTVCSNQSGATVVVATAEPRITYTAVYNNTTIGSATNNSASTAVLTIPVSITNLALGENIVRVRASVAGCASVDLADTALVTIIPLPKSDLTVDGSVVCSNVPNTTITILQAESRVRYTAYLGSLAIGNNTNTGNSPANLSISIPTSALQTGVNVISVRADITSCGTVNLSDTARVTRVEVPPLTNTANGSTICTNDPLATVTVVNASVGVTYSAYLGNRFLISGIRATGGPANLVLQIPNEELTLGLNVINIRADVAGCATVNLTDTAGVRKVQQPSNTITINGNSVCSNQTTTSITVLNAEPGVTYSATLNNTVVGSATNNSASATNLTVNIPVNSLQIGLNILRVRAIVGGCAAVDIADTAGVRKIEDPDAGLEVTGGIVCSTQNPVNVIVKGAQAGVTYEAYMGTTVLGSASNNGNTAIDLAIPIQITSLSENWNIINVRTKVAACVNKNLLDTARIKKVPGPKNNLTVTGSVICSSENSASVTIQNAEPDVTYSAYLGNILLGSASSNVNIPTTISISVPVNLLEDGWNIINVRGNVSACGEVNLLDTAGIKKVPDINTNSTATGGEVCSNIATKDIVIGNAQADVTYTAFREGIRIGSAKATAAGNLTFPVNTASLANGLNVITITAEIAGCATQNLKDTAWIIKRPIPPAGVTVTGNRVCSNQDTTTIQVLLAQTGVTYTAYLGNTKLNSNSFNSNLPTNLTIKIPTAPLADYLNVIRVTANLGECATVDITDTARVFKTPLPPDDLTVVGGKVCSDQANAVVIINNAQRGVTYTALLGNTPVGSATNNTNANTNLSISIPVNRLATGDNVIRITASVASCATVNLKNTATVTKVTVPTANLAVNGNRLCSTDASTTSITIVGAAPNVTYTAYLNNTTNIGSATNGNTTGNLVISFPTSNIQNGKNIIYVRADIDGCASIALADTAIVTLDPSLIPGSISASKATVCSGTSPSLINTQLPSGGLPPYNYVWQSSPNGTTWTDLNGPNTPDFPSPPAISGTTHYRRLVKSEVCTGLTPTTTVNVTGLMQGGEIEASQEQVCNGLAPGEIKSISPASGGTGIGSSGVTYQWQSSLNSVNWTNISGALSDSYVPNALTVDTYFRRRATNGNGSCDTTYAGPVLIAIFDTLDPGTISQGDTTACFGTDVTIKSIDASSNGNPATTVYQWQKSIAPFTNWTNISNSNGASYTEKNITVNTRFRRVVTNQCGTDTTKDFYEIKVLPNLETDISFKDLASEICDVKTTTFTVETKNAGKNRTIDWYYNGKLFLLPSGTPDSIYSKDGNFVNGDKIKVVVHADPAKLCTTASDSSEYTLKVNTTVGSNSLSVDNAVVCSGDTSPTITGTPATGTLANPPYKWQVSQDTITWNDIPGATGKDYTPANVAGTFYFRRIALSAGACGDDTSKTDLKLTMDGKDFDGGTISASPDNICEGAVPVFTVTSPKGGTKPYTYQWEQKTGSIWTPIVGATDSVYVSDTLKVTTVFRRKVFTSGEVCNYNSNEHTVNVDPRIGVNSNTISNDHSICEGGLSETITGSTPTSGPGNNTPVTYKWVSKAGNGNWIEVPGATGKDLNPRTLNETTFFRRIVTSTGACAFDTTALPGVKVLVDSAISASITSDADAICFGGTTKIYPATISGGTKAALTYQWEQSFDKIKWSPVPAGLKDTLTSNILDSTTFFRLIVKSLKCIDTTEAKTIVVDTPIDSTLNVLDGDVAICLGQEGSEILGPKISDDTGLIYKWEKSLDNQNWEIIKDSVRGNLFPGAITQTTYYKRTVMSTGACKVAESRGEYRLYVDPVLTADSLNYAPPVCIGDEISLSPKSIVGGTEETYRYQWQESKDSVNFTSILGETYRNLSPRIPDTTKFFRLIVFSVGCDDTTSAVRVRVDYPVDEDSNWIKGSDSLCFGTPAGIIEGSNPGMANPTFRWEKTTNLTDWLPLDSTGKNLSPGVLNETTYFRRYVTSTGACENAASDSVIRIYVDKVTISLNPDNKPQCEGTDANITATVTGGISPQWQSSVDKLEWNEMVGEISTVLKRALDKTTHVRLIVHGFQCTDTSDVITINVDPIVKDTGNYILAPANACETWGGFLIEGSNPTSVGNETKFAWSYRPYGEAEWRPIAGASGPDYRVTDFTKTTAYRRIITTTGACDTLATAKTLEVVFDPEVKDGLLEDDKSFCDDAVLNIYSKTDATGGIPEKLHYTWSMKAHKDTVNFKTIIGEKEKDLKVKSEDFPRDSVVYYVREARSVSCFVTDTVNIFACETPFFSGDTITSICFFEGLLTTIVSPADTILNNKRLKGDSIILQPSHGKITLFDTINNQFKYEPEEGFVGIDSISFRVCNVSKFPRCSEKKMYLSVLPINHPPVVLNESVQTYRQLEVKGNVLLNDSDPDNDTLLAKIEPWRLPKNGVFSIKEDGNYTYLSYPGFVGKDTAIVVVCDTSSELRCYQPACRLDTIFLNVKPNEVVIPDGYSPNNDGINDAFVIKTESPSNIHIAVYNRWGNLVYENFEYKNDWDGRANKGLVIGEGLPDGTYYVYYNINFGEFDGFKYITINR